MIEKQFMAARRAGTPLIAIKTLDPEATMRRLQLKMNPETPIIQWDAVRGMTGRNKIGEETAAVAAAPLSLVGLGPVAMLADVCPKLPYRQDVDEPTNPVVFMLNAHHFFEASNSSRTDVIQAVWNLRIPFRDSLRSLVMLAPDFNFPPEIQHDILILDEPLPSDAELSRIIKETTGAAGVKVTDDQLTDAINALRGLSAFEAESSVAMSLTKSVLKVNELWLRKKQLISATPGLTVWVGGQKFDGLGGLDEIKRRFRRIIAGKAKPRVIVWIDEVEKMLGDGTGQTSSDQFGVLLSEHADKEYDGVVLMGVPGAAKSDFAKAIANESGCITIKLDLGDARGNGFVGQAENEIRDAFKIIEAVGGHGGAFFVLTSNDIRVIKPELKRRMKKGIWFFDLLTQEERDLVWEIYFNKYPDVDRSQRAEVNDQGWTGAEIKNCVQTAWEENVSLAEAARSIIPVATSGAEDIERMRRESAGRFNSASYAGVYVYPSSPEMNAMTSGRKFAAIGEDE